MVDKILLKNDGTFVADDYQSLERASGRLRELENDGKQLIKRNRGNGLGGEPANEAALLAASVYEAAIADTAKPGLYVDTDKVFDDDLGRNITLYMDLIQARVQVPANQSRVNNDGKPRNGNKGFLIYNTNTTLVDNRGVVDGDDQNLGDVLLGILTSPNAASFYENAGSLTDTTYSGTGDGTLDKQELLNGSVAETITITASSGGPGATFDVVGSVGGAYGSYTSGSGDAIVGPVCINISDGATDFVATDEFVITSVEV